MTTTKTTDLMPTNRLVQHFGVKPPTISAWLETAGVQPELVLPHARGSMRLYDPKVAIPELEKIVAKRKPARKWSDTEQPSAVYSLESLASGIAALTERVELARDHMESLSDDLALANATIARLEAQNRLLLTAIEKVGGGVEKLVGALA